MKRLVEVAICVVALTGAAVAEPFWIEYDASCGLFPEEVGWDRLAVGGGAQRSLEGGVLTLDGLASTSIVDDYGIVHPIDLGPGESFVAEWRLLVDEVVGRVDPVVGVWSEGYGRVILEYSDTSIYSLLEGVWIDFEPHVFHDYALVSSDMLTYTLSMDGTVVYAGQMIGPSHYPGIGWGDAVSGDSSLSVWDYVRFGVVPEPFGALITFVCLAGILLQARRTRRISQ